jgi:sulfatase maturation enzyme AslB (radical SAM superfamily)
MRPYLPALNQAKFLGGEPFLISEHFHIWDMMIEDCLTTRCHVTTNGTQYNERICRYLDRLPFGFSVSLDAATKSTYEAIRIRGSFDEVMHNSRRFRDYARERNTSFSFTFCLTRHNWKEFGEFCLMADSWDAAVGVNTVRNPPSLGIYTMPIPEMRAVLNGLEHQSTALERHLKRNRRVWLDEIERLRARVCAAETDRASSQIKHL